MSTSTFDAIKHPRKGTATDSGNAGHFAAKVLSETNPEGDLGVDLDFLVDESGDFTYDTQDDLSPAPAVQAQDFGLDFLEQDAGGSLGFGMVPAERSDPDPYYGSLRESELYEFTRVKARLLAGDYDNIEADTLVAEAVISYMSAVRKVSTTTGEDMPVSPVATDPAKARGFLFNAMKNIARREAFGTAGHDMKGHRELSKAIEAETQATGAPPTSARVDELAEQVRLSFEPRRRPSIGFHRKVRTVSMDAATDTGAAPALVEAERAMSAQAAQATAEDFERGSLGEQVASSLTTPDRRAHSAALRSVWDVVREGSEAPAVAAGSLDTRKAAALRRELADAGGVRAALRAWDAAEDDHPAVSAVFTVFGSDATDDDRCAIMEVLAERPAYAPDLLDAAITTATATASRKKKD